MRKLKPAFAFFATIFLFNIFFIPCYGQSYQLEAIVNGNRHVLPGAFFPEKENINYITVEQLAEALNLQTYYSNNSRKAILYLGEKEIKITALNPFVSIGDRILQMPVATYYKNGEIYVPTTHFLKLLAPYLKGDITLLKSYANRNRSELHIPVPVKPEPTSKAATKIINLDIEEKANGTLIRIKTNKPVDSSHINSRITNGWLYVDIYQGSVVGLRIKNKSLGNLVREIIPVQLAQSAQLSFKINGEIAARKIYTNTESKEILVSLTTEEIVSTDLMKSLEDERKKWLIDTIIIDPGHGGYDPGAVGPGKVFEKDVTLAIALKLQKLLKEKTDIRVIMTRNDDRFVPLKNRTQIANSEQGKLFISIHANSNRNHRVSGLTTYFLGQAKTEEALEVSRRENAVINYENDKTSYADLEDEGFILLSLAQNAYQKESEELAAIVQAEISKKAKIKDRGVKQAGYYVLIGASMPNILVETAFISNKKEARLLKTASFQKKLAEGIYASVLKFKNIYEQGI
jgi:N-acetylmuramoyl-L-alanine amidase